MVIFYIELIVVYILSLFSDRILSRSKVLGSVYVVIVTFILSLISGLRTNIGDTFDYIYLYKIIGPSYISNGAYESGFIVFFKFLKRISDNPQFMLMVTSFIINIFIIYTIRKFPGYFELAVLMYITSGYYLVTMNGIRQSLAAAVLFACSTFIINGKFKYFFISVLIMSTIHSSAIIMLPVYFLVRNEAWSRNIYILIFIFIVGLMLYAPLMNVVYDVLGNSKYSDYKNFNEGGANIIRLVIFAVPVLLSYIKRNQIKENWPKGNVIVNMALLNFIVMCFSLNNWIFARFALYFELYNYVLLAYIIRNCTSVREKRLVYYALIISYTFFFWYEQAITLKIQYNTNFKMVIELYKGLGV